jgi:Tfp pilus assembly protein FimV
VRAGERVPEANYLLRRVVAVIVAVSVVAAAAVAVGEIVGAVSDLGGRPAAASEVTGADATPALHVAAPGDTLWSIADRYRGDVSHTRYVDALVSLNGGADVQIGQAVRLP